MKKGAIDVTLYPVSELLCTTVLVDVVDDGSG